MTRVAIMQPAYLPWLGYFDLMASVDAFVLLDVVQFSYQSWQHRNRIRTPQGLRWLTVPVRREGRLSKTIAEMELAPGSAFPDDHVAQLELHYRDAPFGGDVVPDVATLLRDGAAGGRLAGVTVPLVRHLAARLGLTVEPILASTLDVEGRRSSLLVAICRGLGADEYLSPRGAVDYLRDDADLWRQAGIDVLIQRYEHPEYPQRYSPFLPFASAVDLICNAGPASRTVLDTGHRPPDALAEVDE